MNQCGACGLFKVKGDFYRDVRYPDVWTPRAICKVCMSARRKAIRPHWLAKPCTGCKQMIPMNGFYMQNGSPHMPCKACRAEYRPPSTEATEKRCSHCGVTKEISEFGHTDRTSTCATSWCLACMRARRPASIEVPTEKRCSLCKLTKPAEDFYRTDRTRNGLYNRCKDCHNRGAYPGQVKYRELNKEQVAEWNRRWQEEHRTPERTAASLAALAAWQVANPESRAIRQERRRARKLTSVNDFTLRQWKALKAAYAYKCGYCGKKPKRLTIDHVVPLARGGAHTASNIIPSCWPCNAKKKAKPAPTHQPTLLV